MGTRKNPTSLTKEDVRKYLYVSLVQVIFNNQVDDKDKFMQCIEKKEDAIVASILKIQHYKEKFLDLKRIFQKFEEGYNQLSNSLLDEHMRCLSECGDILEKILRADKTNFSEIIHFF